MNVKNNLIPSPCFKHTIPVWYFICSLLAFGLPGCRQGQKTDKLVFRYNETTGIATLDPAFAKNQSGMWPVHQLYNTLVEIDSGLNIVPSVAKSWEISFFDNKATEFLQFRQGGLSFVNDIDPSFKDEILTKNGELRYKNPAFDILYEKALQENNDSLRYQLYRETDQLVSNDAPLYPSGTIWPFTLSSPISGGLSKRVKPS